MLGRERRRDELIEPHPLLRGLDNQDSRYLADEFLLLNPSP
jgi:hypothetical protein